MSIPTRRQLAALRRLARLFEVETSFIGTDGKRVTASPETLLRVLQSLGAEAASFEDAEDACRIRLLQTWHRKLDPVTVVWEEGAGIALLRLPEEDLRDEYACLLKLESGELHRWTPTHLKALAKAGPAVDGRRYFEIPIALPSLPNGYHKLDVEVAGETLTATVIAAPRKAAGGSGRDRDWGVFLPLYALYSAQSQGIGDFRDLRELAAWTARRGGAFVGTLPLLATFLDNPVEPSPYAPVSRLFWNEVYVATAAETAPSGVLVDFRRAMANKRRFLSAEAAAFFAAGASGEYEAFAATHPDVEDYARFRAAREKLGPRWREWPDHHRRGQLHPSDYDDATANFYRYAQWRARQQMQEVASLAKDGVEIYLDLPVGVHSDGYDAWRYQGVFAEFMSVGAPPDPLTSTGQDWGFAPLLPDRLRQTGYEYVARYLRHNLSLGGLLRIDHIFGMHRLYCLPSGTDAREGVYVRYRSEELFAVLALESHRAGTRVIGEDIGITPPGFRETMKRHGIGRLYVLNGCIGWNDDMPIVPIPAGSMASFGTHDLPPFAAYWQIEDLIERTALGVLDAGQLDYATQRREHEKRVLARYLQDAGLLAERHDTRDVMQATQAMLAQSAAGHVMVNLEDLWLERRSQNIPGTVHDVHNNWSRRARLSLEQIEANADVSETLELVKRKRLEAARRPTRRSDPR